MDNDVPASDDSVNDDSAVNDESLPTDDTVQRQPKSKDGKAGNRSNDPDSTVDRSPSPADSREDSVAEIGEGFAPGLEEAKTVIRQVQQESGEQARRPGRTPAEIAKVLVGEQLNQYFLDALIGGGGMGAVFRAHDERLDRVVALKVIPFVGHDPELQRRFRNEAQNAAKLDHPRIARVFDAGDFNDWHYIVFEYIKGTNVRDLVDGGGVLSLDDAVAFTSQVAEALDHAAQRGIVHRDIKPSNVLVAEDGTVKLVDMGLARSENLDLSEDMTASGVTLGTFDYISPEQAFDPRDADVRSDLYSLGCTLYFMLTGQPPYTGGTMLQKLMSHGNAPPPDPRTLRPDLPEEAVAIMHRMMAKDPQLRYQNAKDLLADLSELAYRYQLNHAMAGTVVSLPSSNDGLQRLQTHLPWMIATLLVLMVAGYLELQSIPTRDAFLINSPVSNSGNSRVMAPSRAGADDDSSNVSNGTTTRDRDNNTATTIVPNDSVGSEATPTTPANEAGESSAAESTSRENPLESSTDLVDLSELASRGPSISPRLPAVGGPDFDSIERDSDGNSPEQDVEGMNADLVLPSDDEFRPGVEPDQSGGGAAGTISQRSPSQRSPGQTSTVDASSTETILPLPQSVRIVSPSLLALSIRVDQVDRDKDGAILASGFSQAIDLAMRFGVGRIEITVPEIVTGPVTIPQDSMVIESSVGRTTIRMVSPQTISIGRTRMINVGNNRTQFRNLDFHWELSQDQVDGGSMFVINDNRLTQFRDCTFTLVNQAINDRVSFFEIITDPETLPDSETLPGRVLNPDANALPLVALRFENSIVRGEADLIVMDYAAALQLVWNNGLLAISGRMIDTSGALRRPGVLASPIQLSLSDLTAELPRGLLRMRIGPSGNHSVPIVRDATRCVFIVDPDQPYVELVGVETLVPERPHLRIRGTDNSYVGSPTLSDPLLMVSDMEGNFSVTTMSELESAELPWIEERQPLWSVRWSTVRPRTQMFHRLTPTNYGQDGAIYFGFREQDLPRISN